MQNIFIYIGAWWFYCAVGTCLLGRQSGGRPMVWGLIGLLLGPLGMLAALLVPAARGYFPNTTSARCTAFGITFGLLVVSEIFVRFEGGRGAILSAFIRY
jgi:hypothetical protein